MITMKEMLGIIRTEAYEYGGIPEVPDDKHGAPQNYAAMKRDARGVFYEDSRSPSSDLPVLHYTLQLVRDEDGTLDWVDQNYPRP